MQSGPIPRQGRITFQPALDGLRGIALFWMLAFHNEFAWARGGFLPLPTFFVLSGYLITALFLAEWDATGGIRLGAFWSRRLRRLLPASLLGLLGVSLFGLFFATSGQLARLQADVLWALANLANWRFVVAGTDYTRLFEAPSPLQHFWSLAVEEQFYLVYPLILLACLGGRGGSRRRLASVLCAIAVASLITSTWLVLGSESVDRVYYGTDSRAAELAVGCLLALVLDRWKPGALAQRRLQWLGGVGLTGMLACWTVFDLEWRWLYMGGLVGYAMLTAFVIAAAVQPAGPARRLLSVPLLCWAGRISYGVYVYHWPIFLALNEARTGLAPWPLFGLRLVVTFAIATVSYRWLESPIRTGRALTGRRPWLVTPVAFATVALAVTWVVAQPRDETVDLAAAQAAYASRAASITAAAPGPPPARGRPLPRIAVYGDSTALRVALALGDHYRRTGTAVPRMGVAQMGCGLIESGVFRFQGRVHRRPQRCADRTARFGESLARGRPDVAVVLYGPWEVVDRRLPGDRRARAPGDPVFDAVIRDEMEALADLLSRDGALVVWLTSPSIRVHRDDGVLPRVPFAESDPTRMARFNALVRELGRRRPDSVAVLDFAAWMETLPGGLFDEDIRPDGIHTTAESAAWIADTWLADAVLETYRGAEADDREEPFSGQAPGPDPSHIVGE